MRLLQRREAQAPPSKPQRGQRPPVRENRVGQFLRETRSELKKVVWPTREQTTRLTAIVIAVSVAVGLFLGGVDLLFKRLFELLLGGM